jgi:hypothetical protein
MAPFAAPAPAAQRGEDGFTFTEPFDRDQGQLEVVAEIGERDQGAGVLPQKPDSGQEPDQPLRHESF